MPTSMKNAPPENQNATDVDLESRITGKELRYILKICGKKRKDYGDKILLSQGGLYAIIWRNQNKKVPLDHIQKLKEFVGEEHYYQALTEIRKGDYKDDGK